MDDLFVGREHELDLLEGAFRDAERGRGRLVLVAGEPGIGKSRLVDELARRAAAAGGLAVWGRCWELGGAPAYWPWTEAVRDVVAAEPDSELDELARILPELRSGGTPLAGPSSDDPDGARFRLFDAIVRSLRSAAATRPLVVVLEDLHAADESSLLLLEFVVRALASMPVLVVGTYRDVELTGRHPFTDVLAELVRERATLRTVLAGLDSEDVARVVQGATGEEPTPAAASWLREHTGGNPLYVREVARLLAAEGRTPAVGERLRMPRDIRETVLRRVSRLPAPTVDMIGVAAVVGREFSPELVTMVVGQDSVDRLRPAVEAGLVLDDADTPGRLRFAHAVVSEALYDAMPSARRAAVHLAVAEAIERLYAAALDPHLAAVARHYVAALPLGPVDKAVDAARRAGDRALARLAYEEAVRLYAMAIAAASGSTDPGVRLELLLSMGDAHARAGSLDQSRDTFFEAAEVARELGRREAFAVAVLGYGGRFVWTRAARDTRMVPLLREALDVVAPDDRVLRVRLLARLAGALRDEPSRHGRDALSQEAVELARGVGDPGLLAYALAGRFTAIWAHDTNEELQSTAAEILLAADASGDPERQAHAAALSFMAELQSGAIDRCREHLARFHELGEGVRQPSLRWYADTLGAVLFLLEGRLAEAEAAIESARAVRHSAWEADASYLLDLCLVRWEQRRLPELEPLIRQGLVDFPGYPFFRCVLALNRMEAGRADEGLATAKAILADGEEGLPHDNSWLAGMTILAEIVFRLEAAEVAAAMYEAMAPYAHLAGAGGGEAFTGSVHRPLGQLAAVLGRHDDADRHLEAALAAHARMGALLWTAHTEVDFATVLVRRGHAEAAARARRLLSSASERCASHGFEALATRIDQLRATVTPHPTDGRPGGLTKREVEVATLVAGGASNRAIADALVISERTAESHVQNILTKLGFATRSQIAAWSVGQGLGSGT